MNRRFQMQLAVIGLLTVLPVSMIAINGMQAVTAILTPVRSDATAEPEPTTDGPSEAEHERLLFGVYDPEGEFAGDSDLTLRHIYVSWADFSPDELRTRLMSLEAAGHRVLLTIEPWPDSTIPTPLLHAVANGEYNSVIDRLAECLAPLQGPVYLSWGHEMDQDLTERYPWSGSDPDQYVAAYRFVADRLRQTVDTELLWIWSAVLKEGSLRYWPGDTYVDFIGLPVYSFPNWDRQAHGFIRGFRTTFEEKRKIVAELQQPLLITELGVHGSSDFTTFWLHQMFLALDDYPELAGVIFFYSRDSEGAWGADLETPDWRVHPDAIRGLVRWKLQ